MKKRIISTVLLLALIASAGTACGSEGSSDDTTTSGNTDDTTSAVIPEFTPAPIDLGGKTVRSLTWANSDFQSDEETGDVINDAIFRRNRKVEELYNFELKQDVRFTAPNEHGQWLTTLNAGIMAGDHAYQLGAGYSYQLAYNSLDNNFHNLLDSKYIDMSQKWWPSNLIEVANIGNRISIAFGNFDSSYLGMAYGILFNIAVAEDIQIGNLYTLVNDGKWTLDKMFEAAAKGKADLNGDAIMDDNDRYGYMTGENMEVDAFIHACDIKLTQADSQKKLVLLPLSERFIDTQQKVRSFVRNSDIVRYNNTAEEMFKSGKGFLYAQRMKGVHNLRDMNDDFGILPYPKYDEEQEKYYTYNACGNTTGIVIPVTEDIDEIGAVVEALAYYGYKDIVPEYYERTLKGKGARDDESMAMLDIIYDNVIYGFIEVYSFGWGDQASPSMAMRQTVKNDVDIASDWASNEKMHEEFLAAVIEKIS